MRDWEAISAEISAALGRPFAAVNASDIGGGCINAAVRLEGAAGERFFVKLNRAELLPMFEA